MALEQGGKSLRRDFIIASDAERSFDRLATAYWMRIKPDKNTGSLVRVQPGAPRILKP
jgi:hypothetical protein